MAGTGRDSMKNQSEPASSGPGGGDRQRRAPQDAREEPNFCIPCLRFLCEDERWRSHTHRAAHRENIRRMNDWFALWGETEKAATAHGEPADT